MTSSMKFHPQYADPSAKVILQAKDELFRVQEWNLRTHSGFFRDMASVCTEDISSAGPIQSETSPKVLRDFLEVIYIGRKVEGSMWNRDDPVDAIQRVHLAKRWDCELVEKLARASLVSDIEARPWEIFKAASTLKDVGVAKQCLAAFTQKNVPDHLLIWSTHLCLGTFEGVSRDYFFELYRVVQDTPRIPLYLRQLEPSLVNWKSVASQFFA